MDTLNTSVVSANLLTYTFRCQDVLIVTWAQYLPPPRRLCFHLRLFLSVCLSVNRFSQKNYFTKLYGMSNIFQGVGGQSVRFWW